MHTSTSTTGVWDTGTLKVGESSYFTFTQPGMYAYYCAFHPRMRGSITVGSCLGGCRVKTKSGSAHVGSVGAAEITIGSGSVRVDHVEGSVHARAISGSVTVDAEGHGPIEIETMSGAITITLPDGCRPEVRAKSLSGRPRVECPPGHDCVVTAKTLSGGITVRPR